MKIVRPSRYSLALAVSSLLFTLVVMQALWESYYPPHRREALKRRRAYYEKVLKKADLSWKESLYYKEVTEPERRR